ncbi:MAG: tRNA uridine-5-carboxymethylaminomethyl(34) synthesis GTPase MnmE [Candidatus Omnitrophica bacterium]|nr:tRNA uridine-5-carboxymethylaminomethyl(34) synthesis GTPase MnmE [Candidatus Omnitrophota bacterium]
MIRFSLDDTIAAIATSLGESGIGIVRISGREALKIADRIFFSKSGKKPSKFKTYTLHYGWVVEDTRKIKPHIDRPDEFIDEALLTVMLAPYSYTREDVVEINCHGGIVALRKTLELALNYGARLAEPGEFTCRAYLNGRIDLVQAEAVLRIVHAKTESALKLGTTSLAGVISREFLYLREEILDLLVLLEANIDFPEEEIEPLSIKEIEQKLNRLIEQIGKLIDSYRYGRIFSEGIKVVICGKPNVGKSSLLNALLKEERAIVTPIAGTTRDTLEEIIDIRGIPVKLVDTAGIIEPRDLVEREAVKRSKKCIEEADLVILVFDGSTELNEDDLFLIKKLKDRNVLAVINKVDLKQTIDKQTIKNYFKKIVDISVKKHKNIELLEEQIESFVYNGKVNIPPLRFAINLRQRDLLNKVRFYLKEAKESLKRGFSIEFISQDLKESMAYLDELTGKSFNEQLLNRIFSEFCIGK